MRKRKLTGKAEESTQTIPDKRVKSFPFLLQNLTPENKNANFFFFFYLGEDEILRRNLRAKVQ